MNTISGQSYRKTPGETILVRETPQRVEIGKFKGFTPYGEVLVETSPDEISAWDRKNSKTVEQMIAEKNKKLEIMSAFASIQNRIIDKLSHPAVIKTSSRQESPKALNYNA